MKKAKVNLKKVVYLTNIPSPYRVAQLNHSHRLLVDEGYELKAFFLRHSYRRRGYWQGTLEKAIFSYLILNQPYIRLGSEWWVSPGITVIKYLKEEKPCLIVSTAFSFFSIFACFFTLRNNIPFIVHSGETIQESRRRLAKGLRKKSQRYLLSNAASCIAYGTRAREFLLSQGYPGEKIYTAINSVDTENFQRMLREMKTLNKKRESRKLRMLYVGNLVKLKGLGHVLRALKVVQSEYRIPLAFDIVGDGSERERLEKLARRLSLEGVTFWGAVRHEETIPFYLQSDFFIFPSFYDVFGLVMVEAAAAGLPIIASEFAGGSCDIVVEGRNGFIVNPADIEELALKIRKICSNQNLRGEMGNYSLKVVKEKVNIHQSALGFARAIVETYRNTNQE